VKIIPEPSATLKTCSRSLGQILKSQNRNNSAVNCSIAFKCGAEFQQVTGDTLQMFKVKDQRLRSQRKVMYEQQKRQF